MTTTPLLPAAGWYPDPANPAARRYWDGHTWDGPGTAPEPSQPEFVVWRPGQPLWSDPLPRHRQFKLGRTLGLLITLLVLIVAGTLTVMAAQAGMKASRDTLAAPPSAAPSAAHPGTAPAPAPAASAVSISQGTYEVGSDIKAGTYRTAGPADADLPNCYWARLNSTSGSLDAVIANGNPAGPTTVTVSTSDRAFETSGCQTWVRVR